MAHILLIEDDEVLAELLADRLAAAGHMASCVSCGEEAAAAIEAGAPDLVIVDYELPGLSGLHIVREMRSSRYFARTPILMMTAKRSNLLCARAMAGGVTGYIAKPVWPDELVGRVEAILAEHSPLLSVAQP